MCRAMSGQIHSAFKVAILVDCCCIVNFDRVNRQLAWAVLINRVGEIYYFLKIDLHCYPLVYLEVSRNLQELPIL